MKESKCFSFSSLFFNVIISCMFMQVSGSSTEMSPQSNNDNQNRRSLRASTSTSAIVILATSSQSDIIELCIGLRSLQVLEGDPHAPVLIFNEGDLLTQDMDYISHCVDRDVTFPVVNLNHDFPTNFNEKEEWETFRQDYHFQPVLGRSHWSYAQMIRFWTSRIWKHPAIQQYETIMRIDTDSCFLKGKDSFGDQVKHIKLLPALDKSIVYQSFESGNSSNRFVKGLFEFAMEYIQKEGITPSHPELWDRARALWEKEKNVPLFKTNFEVDRISFFQREDVMKWHEALSESEPFGIWRHRWGDAHTRFLTMAIFGTSESVSQLNLSNQRGFYEHGRGKCKHLVA